MEAQLQVEAGARPGAVLMLAVGETKTLGRGPGADLVLDDPLLQPRHAAVRLLEDGLQVVDLGGGTRLNDAPLPSRKPCPAESGDLIQLGGHAVRAQVLGRRRARRRRPALPFPTAEFTDVTRIGAGATGKVYRATWIPHQRPVALKLLREEYAAGTPQHTRLLRECRTVARIQSGYVVDVFDVRSSPDAVYVVMELIEGAPLDTLLARGPLSVPAALRAGEDIARALSDARRAQVVHRDVKPANVLVDPRAGRCRLCDFGLAKDLESTLQTLTALGAGLGTLAYLPPEQSTAARDVGPAADVYALGATVFHALSGRPPFDIETEADLAAALAAQPPRVESLRPEVAPAVGDLVAACLSKDPARRPTAEQAANALFQLRSASYPSWDPRELFSA